MNKTDVVDYTRDTETKRSLEVYTDDEAATILRMSKVTLWRERKKGKITFRRSASRPVYLREDLDAYLERCGRNLGGPDVE